MTDLDYMKMAYELASRASGQTSPNPMVGALIVKNGQIIASGYHKRCGADHAEVAALKKAGTKARGAKLYVTLEPCSHFGRTPPCTDRIIHSGIKEVIIGMIDPNPLNNGKSIRILKENGIQVKVGFLKEELARLNEVFIKFITDKTPFVMIKWAQTLDGKIATQNGQSQWITSQTARDMAHGIRADFDAIMVGINTVLKDDPRLNAQKKYGTLKKIIIDSTLRIPLKARLLQGAKSSDVIIATSKAASKTKERALRKKGVNIVHCPARKGRIDLRWFLKELASKEICSILVEGGPVLIGSLLKEKLVDKVLCFIAPKVMGDQEAKSAVSGISISHVDQAIVLKNVVYRVIDEEMIMEAYVHRDR